jgi:hypothetical protein
MYSGTNPFAELSSSFALARRVLDGKRPTRTKEMDGLKLSDMQWESIVAAWDQEPSRRPGLSSRGEPMIFSWRPETETVHSIRHQPDLSAEEAVHALEDLSSLMLRSSDGSFRAVINVFSFIVRLGRIRIRRHEDAQLRSIYNCLPLKHVPADYESPYFKVFLLLQAHFSRFRLSSELVADLAIVLERIFSLFSVCTRHGWSNPEALWDSQVFVLIRMCVHGMWGNDPQLKQIPHFEDDVSCSINRPGLWLIHASDYQSFRWSRHQVHA